MCWLHAWGSRSIISASSLTGWSVRAASWSIRRWLPRSAGRPSRSPNSSRSTRRSGACHLDPRNFYRKIQGTRDFVVPADVPKRAGARLSCPPFRAGPGTVLYPPMIRPADSAPTQKDAHERNHHRDPHGHEPGVRAVRAQLSGITPIRIPWAPGSRSGTSTAAGSPSRSPARAISPQRCLRTGGGRIRPCRRHLRRCRGCAAAAPRPRRRGGGDSRLRLPRCDQPG